MSQNIRSLEQGFIFVYKDEETEILTLTRGAVGNFSNFTFVLFHQQSSFQMGWWYCLSKGILYLITMQ